MTDLAAELAGDSARLDAAAARPGGVPVPSRLTDRWRSRPEPDPGEGLVYWHVLLDQAPHLRERVLDVRRALSGVRGLHLPPPEWLHLTLMTVCPASALSGSDTTRLLTAAGDRLAGLPAVEAVVEQVLVHAEAIVLRAGPGDMWAGLAAAVAESTMDALPGWDPAEHLTRPWIPHVTLAYSIADQPAAPAVAAAGPRVMPARDPLSTVSLIAQWGPERAWDWEILGTVTLGRDVPASSP